MENLELIAFEMISEIGTAKSLFMEALNLAEEGKFDEADNKFKQGRESLVNAHKPHMNLIQNEANGEKVEFSLLLMHAEDQLMTTEILKELVLKLIVVHKKFKLV